MIYGYIRVSSDKQTVENQRFEIEKFCEKQNLAIDEERTQHYQPANQYARLTVAHLRDLLMIEDWQRDYDLYNAEACSTFCSTASFM